MHKLNPSSRCVHLIFMLFRKAIIVCAVTGLVSTAYAQNYQVSVTRKDANLYKVDGQQIYIRTNYCYEYAYGDAAILEAIGGAGDLKFLESKDECPVKAILGMSQQVPGKYQVEVTQEGDDWYEIFGQNLFVHTSGCFSMAMNENAILDLYTSTAGSLEIDGDECTVDGIYAKLRL
jgi:hypothetical protein